MKQTRKKWLVFLIIGLCLAGIFFIAFYRLFPQAASEPPVLFARGVVVASAQTGQVLYTHNAHLPVYPASTTKLVAVLLILDEITEGRLTLCEMVPVSYRAANVRASRAGFEEGDMVSVHHLIMAAMLPSGSEATMALGEHVFGSEEDFVSAMNRRVVQLDLADTFFANSVGLDDPLHKTTAYDMARLASYIVTRHPLIFEYSSMANYMLDMGQREINMRNTNDMLNISGVTGLKTGSSPLAGASLVFTYNSRRHGDLVFAVMSSPNLAMRRHDSEVLLEMFR